MQYCVEKLKKERFKKYHKMNFGSNKTEIQKYVDMVVGEVRDLYKFWIDDDDYLHIPDPCWNDVKTIDINLWNRMVKFVLNDCFLYDKDKFLDVSNDYSISDFVLRDESGNYINQLVS